MKGQFFPLPKAVPEQCSSTSAPQLHHTKMSNLLKGILKKSIRNTINKRKVNRKIYQLIEHYSLKKKIIKMPLAHELQIKNTNLEKVIIIN